MILLAIDTSGPQGSIALARAPEDERSPSELEILDLIPLEGGTFSAQLVPQIAGLLAKHGLNKADVDAFAAASGPGSFTGLRVGLAVIKALAEILGKPVAAVSRLEALARAAEVRGTVLAALDAGRGETYAGLYDIQEVAQMRSERLLTNAELLAEAAGQILVTPDSKLAEAARIAGLQIRQIESPRSDAIARLGWEKISRGETVSPEHLEANYIRHSDAEIFAKK
jgi:tRNA threonylcarbamoyladenosine biosynthesis protein TsaB